VAGSIRSGRVIEVLTRLVSLHGAPRYLRSDNGPEFVSRAILRWLLTAGGGPIAALAVGMTPEADTASGGNAVYVFALPQ